MDISWRGGVFKLLHIDFIKYALNHVALIIDELVQEIKYLRNT